jgi:hypothetical protein
LLPDPESFGEYQLSYRTGDIVSPRVEPVEPLYRQMEDFSRAIRTDGELRSSAVLGVEVVQTIEAVERALALEGRRAQRIDGPVAIDLLASHSA